MIAEVAIVHLDARGAGIGLLPGGGMVRVPFTLAGERARIRIWKSAPQPDQIAEADLLEVLDAAPDRVSPRCLLFGSCDGCQMQHIRYARQLAEKTAWVRALWSDGPDETEQQAGARGQTRLVEDCVPSPRSYGYRSKITPHHAAPRPDRPLAIGFRSATSRQIVDVPSCALATDAINAHLVTLREALRDESAGGPRVRAGRRRRGATLLLREASSGVTSDPDARVTEQIGDLRLEFFAREFFQNNPFLLPALVAFVVDAAAARGARFLVDAYCGSGLFALAAAPRFEQVVGVEVSAASVATAQANAVRNQRTNVRFIAADAARLFETVPMSGAETSVIVDPPRAGCGAAFMEQLARFRPLTVVYVSCNPETQRRDAAALLSAGYQLRTVRPFDMFPQTRHVEAVSVLDRREGSDTIGPNGSGARSVSELPDR